MNTEIQNLLLDAIEYPRPEKIQQVCLPIWNQPFFYKIDKARALTISYNPTDKGAKTNYPEQVARYKANRFLDSEEIFDLLYHFKKESYWRRNYDLLFRKLGIDSENIAHMDVSFFPYRTLNDYLHNKAIDDTYKFLLQTINLLLDKLEYIFIDGARNKDIINLFIDDYTLIDTTLLPINSRKSHKLYIYKHKTQSTFLIYYACFLYGCTCPNENYVKKLAEYIKEIILHKGENNMKSIWGTPYNLSPINRTAGLVSKGGKHNKKSATNSDNDSTGQEVKQPILHGNRNAFTIKYGNSPKSVRPLLHIEIGDRCILVYSDERCVGVVWEHKENRPSVANGQAEIRFFDDYTNEYKTWHRMCVNGKRLSYNHLQLELENNGEFSYFR